MIVRPGLYRMRNGRSATITEMHEVDGYTGTYDKRTKTIIQMAWGDDEDGNQHFWGEDGRRGPNTKRSESPFDLIVRTGDFGPYIRRRNTEYQPTLFKAPAQPEPREVDAETHRMIVEARHNGHRVIAAGKDHLFDGQRVSTFYLRRLLETCELNQ